MTLFKVIENEKQLEFRPWSVQAYQISTVTGWVLLLGGLTSPKTPNLYSRIHTLELNSRELIQTLIRMSILLNKCSLMFTLKTN